MERKENEEKGGKLEGLPVNSSPYTQYKDMEDYKQQGYTGRKGTSSLNAGGAPPAPSMHPPKLALKPILLLSFPALMPPTGRHNAP